MNAHTLKALFLDALAQVLDNKIFRLLVLLTGGLVLPAFLIAAKPNELVLLWGWRTFDYSGIFETFGQHLGGIEKPNEAIISNLQSLFVDHVAGIIGIFFCIAATAFFVPRMLEKGAADTLFSKPVSRLTLLLTRYLAGLIFVAVLAVILVGGIHLGLMLNSGYSDPGFLWSIPTLIGLFAVLYSVSILCGVVTRSSAAAILITLVFFMFNGCIHGIWRGNEHRESGQLDRAFRAVQGIEREGEDEQLADVGTGTKDVDRFVRVLVGTLNTLHYVLPKTGDVKLIAAKLRKSIETSPPVFEDGELLLAIAEHPPGFRLEDEGAAIDAGGVVWRSEHGTRGGEARILLRRFSRVEEREGAGRPRKRTTSSIAREVEDELRDDSSASDVQRSNDELVARIPAYTLTWTETRGSERLFRKTYLWTRGDWFYEIEVEGPEEWIDDPGQRAPLAEFLAGFSFGDLPVFETTNDWYERQFDWTAPWKYNVFFSIGTTAAFAFAVLGLAWFRLARIDF